DRAGAELRRAARAPAVGVAGRPVRRPGRGGGAAQRCAGLAGRRAVRRAAAGRRPRAAARLPGPGDGGRRRAARPRRADTAGPPRRRHPAQPRGDAPHARTARRAARLRGDARLAHRVGAGAGRGPRGRHAVLARRHAPSRGARRGPAAPL
ncbi:MAG: hypothetical protein AVDCRST_MAG07-2297, partial [uncultured Frankineae bacterium]